MPTVNLNKKNSKFYQNPNMLKKYTVYQPKFDPDINFGQTPANLRCQTVLQSMGPCCVECWRDCRPQRRNPVTLELPGYVEIRIPNTLRVKPRHLQLFRYKSSNKNTLNTKLFGRIFCLVHHFAGTKCTFWLDLR